MPSKADESLQFNTIEESIDAFRNGEFIIVLDSQDRENEGDLIIAADSITPAKMAFMIRYSSGYVCAPIPSTLADKLNLPLMVSESEDPKRTAYTVSIDANDTTLTTGISAQDRSLTCQKLASPDASPSDFRRPGHILPLRAREGGVLERPGHTEAAVDFCRLAGKAPAAVIGEIVEDGVEIDGVAEREWSGMMRRDGCLRFGKRWGLKVCTIEDLVEYVERVNGGAALNGKH
ncbi:3,4-dihydroxy-2-butanone-4-phosphate synthase [Polytolypa hystricis UAMH7299]|uniref:3,4-dihydroxy-2-butanone 4-phosphate synthase n=1 Tax=Polytolypa hystricis (strain UAMH7299) TaxID=1447883 RepID=A0A2B7XVM4_POLH7|nr:3,4-dihydroxy-2-butanone-4-phosphate synthase [Polytolypa hystricis UAMH7299]